LSVLQQTAFYLSAGLGSLINILNPELVILGSWVTSLLGHVMLPTLIEQIQKHSLERPYKAVQFVLSDLSQHSVSLGAATLVLEEYLANTGKKSKRNKTKKGGE
jgi:predicted NBD/HSP70 family sugar kinase